MSSQTDARYSLAVETVIAADIAKVWNLLVNPAETSRLFWGSIVESDFKVGSSIVWKGMWEGKPFEDRGTIKRVEKNSLLQYSHWSTSSDTAEDESKHNLLTFRLTGENGRVRVVLQHDNIATQAMKEHSERMWTQLLQTMKEMAEGGTR
jgi:uncharacterized protein YndB with AHSA1/START domain